MFSVIPGAVMSVRAVIAAVRIIARVTVMAAAVPMAAGIRIIAVMPGIMPVGIMMIQDSQKIDKGNPYSKNGQSGIEDE
jgi:hypothetical protein